MHRLLLVLALVSSCSLIGKVVSKNFEREVCFDVTIHDLIYNTATIKEICSGPHYSITVCKEDFSGNERCVICSVDQELWDRLGIGNYATCDE